MLLVKKVLWDGLKIQREIYEVNNMPDVERKEVYDIYYKDFED